MIYLEDLGCLGTALVELLRGEVDFKVMDGFEVVWWTIIFLAAWETFRHILDFRFSVLYQIWLANLWLGDLNNHIGYEFCELHTRFQI